MQFTNETALITYETLDSGTALDYRTMLAIETALITYELLTTFGQRRLWRMRATLGVKWKLRMIGGF